MVIMFGGSGGSARPLLNDTWAYGPISNTWKSIKPAGAAPSVRAFQSMAYDSATNIVIMFGGATNNWTFLNDTWTLASTVPAQSSALSDLTANAATSEDSTVSMAVDGTDASVRETASTGLQTTSSAVTAAGSVSGAVRDLRPAGTAIAPQGKSMIVGEFFQIRVADPNRDGEYINSGCSLRSTDPTIASVSGDTVTARGEGYTQISVQLVSGTQSIAVEVYANQEEYQSGVDSFGPLWEGPVFTDARLAITASVGESTTDQGTYCIYGQITNMGQSDVALTADAFHLDALSGADHVATSISDRQFLLSYEGNASPSKTWSLGSGEKVYVELSFSLPAGGIPDNILLGFDDGESYIRFAVRDYESSAEEPW
jgi:hypothetical protein